MRRVRCGAGAKSRTGHIAITIDAIYGRIREVWHLDILKCSVEVNESVRIAVVDVRAHNFTRTIDVVQHRAAGAVRVVERLVSTVREDEPVIGEMMAIEGVIVVVTNNHALVTDTVDVGRD